jgi:SEC-C motif-containing protein
MKDQEPCACGSGKRYAECCRAYIEGTQRPDTAEQLMRSRYTGYVLARSDYLMRTWHSSTRPADLGTAVTDGVKWLGLKILRTEHGGPEDREGLVEFVARYKIKGKAERLHEVSRFLRQDGQWLYIDGVFRDGPG